MNSSLRNKQTAFVLAIEPAASVRFMIVEVLRGLGFERVQAASSGKEALHILEIERVDWLLMPLLASEEVNALQLLKLITMHPRLWHTNTSLLIDPGSEDYALCQAFELGLMSWHPKSYVKDMLQNEFQELLAMGELNSWNTTLTAAEYLRTHLNEKRLYKSRLALEQNLFAMYPGNAKLLVSMAEAEFQNGHAERADMLLSQAELIKEDLHPHCQRLRDRHQGQAKNSSSVPRQENILGIKTAVVIDPDTDVLYASEQLLSTIGVKTIEQFEDAAKAFAWLKASPAPDLIFMEWRNKSISGPALVQRIRNEVSQQVPIIIVSSLIKKEEKPLLREMGIDDVLEKPFDPAAFYTSAIWTIQQQRDPSEQKSLERKIRRLLASGKQGEAERLIAQFLGDERIQVASKREIEAEYEFVRGDFQEALNLSAEALKVGGGDSLALLNLAGKCMLKLKQHQGALRCFEKANQISSMNIERLLNTAEANLHLEKDTEAKVAIDLASDLDPDSPMVAEAEGLLALHRGDFEQAKGHLEKLDSATRVASYINNRAVSLILVGRFEEGIALYHRAIKALPVACKDVVAAVTYNLGLAHARYGEYEKAQEVLLEVGGDKNAPISKKAVVLSKRIQHCLEKGTPLFVEQTLTGGDLPAEAIDILEASKTKGKKEKDPKRWSEALAKIEATRGDIGCYLVFMTIEDGDQRAQDLLKKIPHFSLRTAIERGDTLQARR